jgi:hypothetical protein
VAGLVGQISDLPAGLPYAEGTVEKYPPLVFFVTFRDPQGHDSTLGNILSEVL